jgi:hypothetical protein
MMHSLHSALRNLLLLTALLAAVNGALANPTILASVPDAAIVGRGTFAYVFWDIYEATLYAPRGQWDQARPHALFIEYKRALNGKAIADRSVQEIRKQGVTDAATLVTWYAQMQQIFPDVAAGTVLSAVYVPGQQTEFYAGNKSLGVITDDDFGRSFFGIWLGEKTSEPGLRRALLGRP